MTVSFPFLDNTGSRSGLVVERAGDGPANRVPGLAARARATEGRRDRDIRRGCGLASKKATAAIPVVATTGDPVVFGLVSNMSRPGGNITA